MADYLKRRGATDILIAPAHTGYRLEAMLPREPVSTEQKEE